MNQPITKFILIKIYVCANVRLPTNVRWR